MLWLYFLARETHRNGPKYNIESAEELDWRFSVIQLQVMPLLPPSTMSTTSTCLELEELQETRTFHQCLLSEANSDYSTESRSESEPPSPRTEESRQRVLLLKGAREQYALVDDHAIPSVLHEGEILVKVWHVPADWVLYDKRC